MGDPCFGKPSIFYHLFRILMMPLQPHKTFVGRNHKNLFGIHQWAIFDYVKCCGYPLVLHRWMESGSQSVNHRHLKMVGKLSSQLCWMATGWLVAPFRSPWYTVALLAWQSPIKGCPSDQGDALNMLLFGEDLEDEEQPGLGGGDSKTTTWP